MGDHHAAVIFDWDGGLCDSIPIHRKAKKILAAEFPKMAFDSQGHNSLAFLKSQGFSDEEIETYLVRWEELEAVSHVKVFPGTNETLAYLKGKNFLIGALTNRGPRPHNLRVFRESGLNLKLLSFFVLYSKKAKPSPETEHEERIFDKNADKDYHLTPFSKPDPQAIIPIARTLSCLSGYPSSVYYVGDNLVDLKFSRENGFSFIGVLSGDINDSCVWINPRLRSERDKKDFGDLALDLIGGDLIVENVPELSRIF